MKQIFYAATILTHIGLPSIADDINGSAQSISNDFQGAENWSCAALVHPNILSNFTKEQIFFDYYLGLIGCETAKAENGQPNGSKEMIEAFQKFINTTYLGMDVESDLDEDGILGPMTAQAAMEFARDINYHSMFLPFVNDGSTDSDLYRHHTILKLFEFSPDTFEANIEWAQNTQDKIDIQDYLDTIMEEFANSPACEDIALNQYYKGPCFYEASHQDEINVPAPNFAEYKI